MNFPEGYFQLLYNCWGSIRKYDDIEIGTNMAFSVGYY
jgi:hypothetical protein